MAKLNPHEMFVQQLEEAAPHISAEPEYLEILKEPREVLELPSAKARRRDGQVLKAWRAITTTPLDPTRAAFVITPC